MDFTTPRLFPAGVGRGSGQARGADAAMHGGLRVACAPDFARDFALDFDCAAGADSPRVRERLCRSLLAIERVLTQPDGRILHGPFACAKMATEEPGELSGR